MLQTYCLNKLGKTFSFVYVIQSLVTSLNFVVLQACNRGKAPYSESENLGLSLAQRMKFSFLNRDTTIDIILFIKIIMNWVKQGSKWSWGKVKHYIYYFLFDT